MKSIAKNAYAGWFLKTAGLLFLVTGAAKLLSGFGHAGILAIPDPIVGLSFGKLLPAVGVLEALVAVACFSSRVEPRLKTALVAWMATNFLVYRVGLWCIGWHHPCHCMGSLAGALHLSDQAADNIMKGILTFLLLGSYLLLLSEWQVAGGRYQVGAGLGISTNAGRGAS